MDLDYSILDETDTDFQPELISHSEFTSQIGIEYGIIFNNGFGMGIGYRGTSTEQDAAEFTFDGLYGSVRYQF